MSNVRCFVHTFERHGSLKCSFAALSMTLAFRDHFYVPLQYFVVYSFPLSVCAEEHGSGVHIRHFEAPAGDTLEFVSTLTSINRGSVEKLPGLACVMVVSSICWGTVSL